MSNISSKFIAGRVGFPQDSHSFRPDGHAENTPEKGSSHHLGFLKLPQTLPDKTKALIPDAFPPSRRFYFDSRRNFAVIWGFKNMLAVLGRRGVLWQLNRTESPEVAPLSVMAAISRALCRLRNWKFSGNWQ